MRIFLVILAIGCLGPDLIFAQETKDELVPIPIREAVIGEWEMVKYENFEGFRKFSHGWTLQDFSENLKFELVEDGKLKRSGAGHPDTIEKEYADGRKWLYVEGNHLKSYWPSGSTEDYYIENGRLHFVHNWYGSTWKRIYEKIR